ncbi:hypothetical protein LB553_20950 [Mesorhizobium sp. CA8]|nr:hypothetical protein [Mesorhizobium sp. CA8]
METGQKRGRCGTEQVKTATGLRTPYALPTIILAKWTHAKTRYPDEV